MAITDELWRHLSRKQSLPGARVDFYARLVREAPTARWGRFWVLADYASVRAATTDPHLQMASPAFPDHVARVNPSFVQFFTHSMSVRAPRDHKRLRSVLMPEFGAAALRRLQESVADIVTDLVEPALDRGHLDFVADIAEPLPVYVTAELLGLPRSDWPRIRHYAHGLLAVLGDSFAQPDAEFAGPPAGLSEPEFGELRDYVLAALAERTADPDGDLLSRLKGAVASGRCDHTELVDLVLLMFMTGVDTVTSALTNTLLCALERPGYWPMLTGADEAAAFFAESVRLMTPVAFGAREVHADTVVNGTPMRAGDVVTLIFAAANLDPAQFRQPLEFRPGRTEANVSFGHGTYFCVGSVLGALEAQTVLQVLAHHDVTLAEPVTWRDDLAFNSPSELSLDVRARTGAVA